MKVSTRQKTMVVDYNVYIAKDGKEFNNEKDCIDYELRLDGTRITCPDCNGKGHFRGRWVEAYDNYDIGHVEAHYEYNTCQRCHGKGYLDKKVTWE